MSEPAEGDIKELDENIFSYVIDGRNGENFPAQLFKVSRPIGETPNAEVAKISPQIVDLAKRCFTHWTDGGERFARVLATRANRVSVIYDPKGEKIVAFNVYEQGRITPAGVEGEVDFAYTHYAGVEPEGYRGQGLMEQSRTNDTRLMNPDAISGCTANGAILRGVRATAGEQDRVMYPNFGQTVPTIILNVGRAIYSRVNGESAGQSVDNSLVRHGASPYLRGDAPDPLVNLLPTANDAILYVSASKRFASRVSSTPLPKVK